MASASSVPVGLTEGAVRVQPVVLFTICDAYVRRNAGQRRVIGALLGAVSEGVVEVRSAYAVPFTDDQGSADGQVAVDHQHHATMLSLRRKADPRERMVGWFSSDADLAPSDALLHRFFASTADAGVSPVLLKVDASLGSGACSVAAYSSRPLTLGGAELAREFLRIGCEVAPAEPEQLAIADVAAEEAPAAAASTGPLAAPSRDPLGPTLEALGASLDEAIAALDAARAARADPAQPPAAWRVARDLAAAAAAVPHLAEADLKALLAREQRDLLVAVYFADLVKTHLAIADKLGTLQMPLL